MKAAKFAGTMWDGKALYISGEDGVSIKVGKPRVGGPPS